MKKIIVIGLIVSLVLAILLSPFASSSPDGLEKVGEDKGFIEKAHSFLTGLIPDYVFPGVSDEKIATAIAGGLGVLVVFGITYLLMLVISKRDKSKQV
ncbi:MAG: PDGLE domain-containing protein [Planctomycetes bacterium]|nr:PDGLE domain-containing protein [Planctomycetota bacterium]